MALVFDSQKVQPGDTFFAIRGKNVNGEDYIQQAIANGASTIVLQSGVQIAHNAEVAYHYVDNVRKELAMMAAESFSTMPHHIIGITGTSGKSSTVGFLRQLWEHCGLKAASIGTLGVISNDMEFDSTDSMTSPDPVTLHTILQSLAEEQVNHVALEVSSHGLDQNRLDGIKFQAGAFTNFTQDHLDYHHSMQEYFNAKMRFFKELLPKAAPVLINKNSINFAAVRDICTQHDLKIITFGNNNADISFMMRPEGLELLIHGSKYTSECFINVGFQHENIACAVGLAIENGLPISQVINAIPNLAVAIGRLEKIATYKGADIYVDYAHKPDALEKVLKAARKFTKGRLHVLFGCGGDRDKPKRAIMGEIATRLADCVIITDDNPRSEVPAQIRREIMQAASNAIEIADRRNAINSAIASLSSGDSLIVAGKGHEEYQVIGDIKYRFNDAEEIIKAIKVSSNTSLIN